MLVAAAVCRREFLALLMLLNPEQRQRIQQSGVKSAVGCARLTCDAPSLLLSIRGGVRFGFTTLLQKWLGRPLRHPIYRQLDSTWS